MTADNKSLQAHLSDGIAAVNNGHKDRARELLRQVVEQDREQELAWWWLSQVTDDPRERWRALEHVLRLNPDHFEAKAQLTELMPTRAAHAKGEDAGWSQVMTGLRLDPNDGVDDPYQCPYCGRLTQMDDRVCPYCGGALYVRVRKSASSAPLRTLFLMLILNLSIGLLATAGPIFALAVRQGADPADFSLLLRVFGVQAFLGNFLLLSGATAQLLIRVYLVRSAVAVLLMLGLRQRWRLAYYGTLVLMLADIALNVYLLAYGYLGTVAVVLNLGLDIAAAIALFGANYEFAVNHERLWTRPDGAARGPVDFFQRGHDYRRAGMWALAVAQWRKSVGLAPNVTRYYKDLGLGYAQINRFDRSLRALAEAQRQAPDDEEVKEIIALVRAQAGAQRSQKAAPPAPGA